MSVKILGVVPKVISSMGPVRWVEELGLFWEVSEVEVIWSLTGAYANLGAIGIASPLFQRVKFKLQLNQKAGCRAPLLGGDMKKTLFARRVGWSFIGLVGATSLALASQRPSSIEAMPRLPPALTPSSGPRLQQAESPPDISSLLKPEVLRRMLEKREVMTFADLSDVPISETPPRKKSLRPLREYRYYTGVLVKAPLQVTRSVIRDYQVYTELVPYIDRAEIISDSGDLALEGGIWKYRIRSRIKFEEVGERWIRFQIIQGHFLISHS